METAPADNMAVGMLSSVTAFAANVSMNLFYNGKNHAYNAKEIVVKIDGKTMTPKDMPAVAIDGRTLLPMRQIAQELGSDAIVSIRNPALRHACLPNTARRQV